MVSTYAQNEQNFNAVERLNYYTELPDEGAVTTPNDPPPSWPEGGEIKFKDVEMSYRPGLPPVLKGVSFEIKPSEKVRFPPCCYRCGVTVERVPSDWYRGQDRSGKELSPPGTLPGREPVIWRDRDRR